MLSSQGSSEDVTVLCQSAGVEGKVSVTSAVV